MTRTSYIYLHKAPDVAAECEYYIHGRDYTANFKGPTLRLFSGLYFFQAQLKQTSFEWLIPPKYAAL